MYQRALALADQFMQWRRMIHQYPELAFQETSTARFVAQKLKEWGLEVHYPVGKTGVVGYLGVDSPTIALRADMDALPITEKTGLPFASRSPGIMHACGHDAHVACLLGAARLISEGRPKKGSVRFLFQPSEETVDEEGRSGAIRMIQGGALVGVEAIIGLHVWTSLPVGQVALSPGPQMAATGNFNIRVQGKGGHGAAPHRAIDPVILTAQVIMRLQAVVARCLDPTDTGLITIGTIHGGSKNNIIPDYVDLSGTIRAFKDETLQQLKDELVRSLEMLKPLGGDYRLEWISVGPVLYNNPQLTALVREVAVDLLGRNAVLPAEPVMNSEDFSFFARQVPGCFFRLGAGFIDRESNDHHNPHFDIDEKALPIGASLLAETALRYLSQKG